MQGCGKHVAFAGLISWGMTVPFVVAFVLILTLMHPVFLIAHAFGRSRESMQLLNFLLNRNLRILAGARYFQDFDDNLPSGRPLIVVSNHQSMFDIPLIYEVFGRFDLKFIAKVELKRGIPSVSWVLRNLGSALIKRDDARQSLSQIKSFGVRLEEQKLAVLIFPEGTRAKDGVMKPFLAPGLVALLKASPSALVVPMVLDGPWEIVRHRLFPVPFGKKVTLKVLAPVEPSKYDLKELPEILDARIRNELHAIRKADGMKTLSIDGGQ